MPAIRRIFFFFFFSGRCGLDRAYSRIFFFLLRLWLTIIFQHKSKCLTPRLQLKTKKERWKRSRRVRHARYCEDRNRKMQKRLQRQRIRIHLPILVVEHSSDFFSGVLLDTFEVCPSQKQSEWKIFIPVVSGLQVYCPCAKLSLARAWCRASGMIG